MRTLIFDFDGTLADNFKLGVEIAYELTGIDPLSDEEIERLSQLPVPKIVRELHIPLRKLPGLVIKERQKMHERIHEVKPFVGMPQVLKRLSESGNSLLVISSNSEENVQAFLKAHKLNSYFDGVYGGVALFSKSSILRKVIKRNKIDKSECYYIGDEVRDIVSASRAGVEPVVVSWGYQSPEALAKYHPFALANKPSDLLEIFAVGKV
jgi:phosphoglycolate phosphatase